MDYKHCYSKLTGSRKESKRVRYSRDHKNYIYYESHHIVPRCLGGSNKKENLVLLTAREHLLAHLLLVEIYRDTEHYHQMVTAVWCMSLIKNRYMNDRVSLSCRQYERVKLEFSKIQSGRYQKENNPNYGKKWTSEQKEHMSNTKKGTPSWNKGLTKDNNESLKRVGEKISKFRTNNPKRQSNSIETNLKIKNANIGRSQPQLTCTKCGLLGSKGNINRWHNDNCRN